MVKLRPEDLCGSMFNELPQSPEGLSSHARERFGICRPS
jgi:hypothetical protein